MLNLILITLEALFVIAILVHMTATNKSINRLEEKFKEMEDEVLKKEVLVTTEKPSNNRRTRKPKEVK